MPEPPPIDIHLPWHNPHAKPSDDQLIAHYAEQLPDLIRDARASINTIPAVRESLAWHGLPWRWSWAYQLETQAPALHDTLPLAYVVPAVAAPEICVPLMYETYERLPKEAATPLIREGISVAREVGDHRWATWVITQAAHLEDVRRLIESKASVLAGRADPARAASDR